MIMHLFFFKCAYVHKQKNISKEMYHISGYLQVVRYGWFLIIIFSVSNFFSNHYFNNQEKIIIYTKQILLI